MALFAMFNEDTKMDRNFLPRIVKFAVICVFFLNGCASVPPKIVNPGAVPPKVNIGPEIQLMTVSAKAVSAVMDMNGKAHILIATSNPRELHYLVISPQGVVQSEIMKKTGSFDHIDLALDGEDRMHAIVDNDHLMLEKGVWSTIRENQCQRFVQGGKDLVCTFTVSGKDVEAPGRWDVYGFASGAGGFVWPWYTIPSKVVLIRKTPTGWSDWMVLDRKTKLGIKNFKAMSDDSGTVHVVYQSEKGGYIAASSDIRTGYTQMAYARLESTVGEFKSDKINKQDAGNSESQKSVAEIHGDVFNLPGSFDFQHYDMAVDPESDIILFAYEDRYAKSYRSCLIRQREIHCGSEFFSGWSYDIYLAAAGDHGFHAIVEGNAGSQGVLYYLDYRNNKWSSPVEIAESLHESGLVKLVSDRSGRALLIWPKKGNALAARWIEPIR
jgi:hypothetical protein